MGVVSDGTTVIDNGAVIGVVSWQSAIKTTSFAAVAGEGYWVNTTSGAITITLPASASVGDQIIFTDYARTWGTNAVTVNQNSLNFQGDTTPNPEYNTDGQSVSIVYSGATKGWIPTVDDDVTNETIQPPYSVDFLVIAGGGGGGGTQNGYGGGGGGAGGYRASYNSETSGGGGSSESSLTFNPSTVYTITVGDGGAAGADNSNGAAGTNSSIVGNDITDIISAGGGYGASASNAGGSGGSGGGGGYAQSGGSGTSNQGYAGGAGVAAANDGKGGGGGAGATGANGTGSTGGNGGNGVASTITGSSVTRAGGGGGGSAAGQGSGGSGGATGAGGGNATANTGSGAGGASLGNTNAGVGASGVVILRMPTASYSGTVTGAETPIVDGLDTILIFNASGSYTA